MRTKITTCLALLLLVASTVGLALGCSPEKRAETAAGPAWSTLNVHRQVPLTHAAQFSLTEYDQDYTLLTIPASGRFLIVPQGAGVPRELDEDVVPLYAPLDRIYMAATSAMDYFRALDSIDRVRLSCLDVNGWYIEEAKAKRQHAVRRQIQRPGL